MMVQTRVAEIIKEYGGLRRAARLLNIDPAYLWRLSRGKKRNPGGNILAKLGLEKIVDYKRR